MLELAKPSNNSFQNFKTNWKNVVFGSMSYWCRYPISSLPVFKARFDFTVLKKSKLTKPIKTPEGFKLKAFNELLTYCEIFIEKNLAYKPFLKEFSEQESPLVIDIGHNCGLVARWLFKHNCEATIRGYEVLEFLIQRSFAINRDYFENLTVFHKAAWNKSDEIITINIGDNVTTSDTKNIVDKIQVKTCAVQDDLKFFKDIYLVKIDTDGSNVKVLEGLKERIEDVHWIIIEKEPGVMEWIRDNLWTTWEVIQLTHCDYILRNLKYDYKN